jgi:putative PIN family toxin of toxin-antitoxin system
MGDERIVLDTNVLVSGLLSPHGAPARILNLIVNGDVILVLDSRIFSEYSDVLKRKRFSFPSDAVDEILSFIRNAGIFVSPNPLHPTIPDLDDLPFVEVAAHEHVPVVTGNLRHFRGCGVSVMTPKEFIDGIYAKS